MLKCGNKINRVLWVLVLLPVIFLQEDISNGMNGTGKSMNNIQTFIIHKQDNGKELKVSCGDVIQIELEEMGSAGFKWYVDSLNTEYTELFSEETKAVSPEEKIGAPVLGIWRFKALKKGSSEIKMDHYRVWDGKYSATEHFSIKLTIQ